MPTPVKSAHAFPRLLTTAGVLLAPAPPASAQGERPMYVLETFGATGREITPLLWGLIILSIAVVVVISALVLIGIARRRLPEARMPGGTLAVTRSPGGLGWIYFGLALTLVALTVFVVWTFTTMAAIGEPAEDPPFTIEITAQQWWWEAHYTVEGEPSRSFETANELHIPVGVPVRIKLASADVIHSFWIPALGGKTDAIPGQTNETWIQAEREGVYRGQCAEYCGKQHAHMAMRVFADPPHEFEAWWNEQLEPAGPVEPNTWAEAGRQQFQMRCGICHTVRGTPAGGEMGPDLTHLMSRTTIAAATLPNTVGHLSGWVANPQYVKPDNYMPNLEMSGPQLAAIRAYLLTLD